MPHLSRYAPWLIALGVYAVFWTWYTPFGGPLSEEEVDAFMSRPNISRPHIGDGAFERELRQILEADDGRPFVMVNLIHYTPDGAELNERYMAYMWPALLQRACHPVFAGEVIGPAMDVWGIEGAERWSGAALMRYRSLRDLIAIVSNPAFSGSHEFKALAMAKTIAVPVSATLNPGDLRVLVGLVLLVVALAVSLISRKRES